MKIDIRSLSEDELCEFFVKKGFDSYRGKQVYEWIWKKSSYTFDNMTNISKDFRLMLDENFVINHIEVDKIQKSSDGTIKNAVKLFDDYTVESVLIPTDDRTTACVSSQVGCSLDCKFCATSKLKRMRNLNPDEIYDQVVTINNQSLQYFNRPLSNIVFMGMGEPFLNYQKVVEAAKIMNEKMNLGSRRITISTAGIVSKIYQMADDKLPFKLAVSLNAPNDEIRKVIMPLTITNPINELLKAAEYYYNKLRRFITFEYVLLENVNSDEKCARQLIHLLKNIPCKVNLIPYNEIESEYKRPSNIAINNFERILKEAPFTTTVRWSKGTNIDAGCGQLAVRV